MGLQFMQEMLELTKMQSINQLAQLQVCLLNNKVNYSNNFNHSPLQAVAYATDEKAQDWIALMAGPSHFSPELIGDQFVEGDVMLAKPFRACDEKLENADEAKGKILVAERGDCTFVSKARLAQKVGAVALIVCDNVPGSSGETQPMFAMSGDGKDDVLIPVVFMYSVEFGKLSAVMQRRNQPLGVRVMQMVEFKRWQLAKAQRQNQTVAATQKPEKEL